MRLNLSVISYTDDKFIIACSVKNYLQKQLLCLWDMVITLKNICIKKEKGGDISTKIWFILKQIIIHNTLIS